VLREEGNSERRLDTHFKSELLILECRLNDGSQTHFAETITK
jgi:hypothetical protein